MQDLIVLGIIPGTNFQIGFYAFLAVFLVASSLFYSLRKAKKHQLLFFLMLRISLAQSVKTANLHQEA